MLRIRTSESFQRQKLQQQCEFVDGEYLLCHSQTNIVKQIFQSIVYQCFQGKLQDTVLKLLKIVKDLEDFKCNLSEFRELVIMINKKILKLQTYADYFKCMNQNLQQNSQQNQMQQGQKSISHQPFIKEAQDNDQFSQKYCFSQLLPEYSQCYEKDRDSQKTMDSSINNFLQRDKSKQVLNQLFSAQSPQNQFQEYHNKFSLSRESNQSSKQISQFTKKGNNIILAQNIQDAFTKQTLKETKKHQTSNIHQKKSNLVLNIKYNKLVKQSLMKSKRFNRQNIKKYRKI